MANCVTCGDSLHPARAEMYDYCTRPECQERNVKPLEIVAVGVNKAAAQYIVLTERAKEEMASGRYKKVPGVPRTSGSGTRPRRIRSRAPAPVPAIAFHVPSLSTAMVTVSSGSRVHLLARGLEDG